ncbi:glycosyltransferase family 4 protein [Marinococcus luteus]|uniref:glycosyltransferase family 4 protein n=1 Tax=Marinococcus luteus TaxID=1122204 RepID=UPI002ACCEC2B|nr:glycosyltransferase family 4 protein [Marinococcus luteus]MDZ5784218.1 glycosyltransferase family 4 protein [Marinococcus luteus]
MKNIVFVVNYFSPDVASLGQLMGDLCVDLQKDFNITVITSHPHYADDLQQALPDRLEWNGSVKVIRMKLPKVNKQSKVSRITYMAAYFFKALRMLVKETEVDVIYTVSQPPILGGLIGTIGKRMKKAKHIYNIQDFNPEQAEAVSYSPSPIVTKIAAEVDKLNCRYADMNIVVGSDMAATLQNRFNTGTPDYEVIHNWVDEEDLVPKPRTDKGVAAFLHEKQLEDKFIVMYSGNLGLFYDLENIIRITEAFREYRDIAFVFIGEGAKKKEMEDYAQANRLENVYFFPYEPKERIKYSLNAADVHLVVNQKGIKGVSVPSKIYGVLAVGKPVLGVLENGSEAAVIIERSGAGVVIEPGRYEEIIDAVYMYYHLPEEDRKAIGQKGRLYLEQHLTRRQSIDKYKAVLQQV